MKEGLKDASTWVRMYPVDSLQIYFAASLELQEEFIKNGFYVPRSPYPGRKVVMPIPLIYSNFRGWLRNREPITIERLIPPQWLGLSPRDLGWEKVFKDDKEAYIIPMEEVYVNISIHDSDIVFDLDIKKYHLERTSIRGVNPDKWTNWAMFYISLEYIDELISELGKQILARPSYGASIYSGIRKPVREVQQGGKEVTYYVPVRVRDFSFCLGCFDLAQRYLYVKAREHCIVSPASEVCRNPSLVINRLRLRLRYSREVDTFAKVGVAKIEGKRPQIMIKLASEKPRRIIKGILKDRVEGKARGDIVYCDHKVRKQYVVLDLREFYEALCAVKGYVSRLSS